MRKGSGFRKNRYLCALNEKGCPKRAENIPYEPDPVNAGGGIGFQILTVYPFSLRFNIKSI